MSANYDRLGVSASKAGLHSARARAGFAEGREHFSDLLPDIAGDPQFFSFLHCDGAGTKSIVAYLLYRESGERSVFAGLAQDALVMNLDDIYAVGEPASVVVANLIARNSQLIDDEILTVLLRSYRELVDALVKLGIPLTLGGGETADAGDIVRTLLVDAVVAGRMSRDQAHSVRRIVPGDVIVGFSSSGRASYEGNDNSGIGSNGLTLARHALLSRAYAEKYPEILAPEIELSRAYRGPCRLLDEPAGLRMNVGEALLSPTRTYAPLLRAAFGNLGSRLHAAIHLTGGGQTKVLRFGSALHYVKHNLFPPPPIFRLIEEHGKIPRREMYEVFNMGHRMEVYLEPAAADDAIATAKDFGISAQVVGEVRPSKSDKNHLTITSEDGTVFEYGASG